MPGYRDLPSPHIQTSTRQRYPRSVIRGLCPLLKARSICLPSAVGPEAHTRSHALLLTSQSSGDRQGSNCTKYGSAVKGAGLALVRFAVKPQVPSSRAVQCGDEPRRPYSRRFLLSVVGNTGDLLNPCC